MFCKNAIDFYAGQPDGKILVDWWKNLDGRTINDLRRRTSLHEFLFNNWAFSELCNRLGFDDDCTDENLVALVAVASLVVCITSNTDENLMVNYGKANHPNTWKDRRFTKLMDISDLQADYDEFCNILKDIIKIAGGRANVNNLADTVYRWDDEGKLRWATSYGRARYFAEQK